VNDQRAVAGHIDLRIGLGLERRAVKGVGHRFVRGVLIIGVFVVGERDGAGDDDLDLGLLVDGCGVSGPLLDESVDDALHLLGIDLELLHEVSVTLVALGVDEIVYTLLHLVEVEVSHVVSLDHGTEVDSEKVADGVDLSF
jgi:hypothetical protein